MLRTWLFGCVTAVILALGSIAPAKALLFNFTFDATPNATVTAPIIGTGTFEFDGDPGIGTFALTSLPNYDFNFNLNSVTFTNTDIVTPLANIVVSITGAGSDRFVNFGGSAGGPFGGSIDFVSSTSLSFQPGFGPLFFSGSTLGTYQGIAAADPTDPTDPTDPPTTVPEPMALGLFGLGLAGLATVRRRRR